MPKGIYPRKPGLKRNMKARPMADRFWPKVHKTESCWLWTGAKSTAGYGTFNLGRRGAGYDLAHRISYRLAHGTIPDGLTLDHLCRVRHCVNPEHLEPVTHRENVMRGAGPKVAISRTGKCARGHDVSAENTQYHRDGRIAFCKVCRRDKRQALREGLPTADS